MKEEIEKVLSDETLTTNEERVDAIAKSLATLMIPKDKYNDLNAKYKTVESNYSTLSTEYDDFKKSKMTDDEKREAELKQLEVDKKANALKTSELAVKGLFLDNGIKITDEDTELKETLQNIISEDCDKSVRILNGWEDRIRTCNLLNPNQGFYQVELLPNMDRYIRFELIQNAWKALMLPITSIPDGKSTRT